ncbi:MAG: SDR family NAD(P)-dependent oxidoreductase [Gammaproteobacteria bacterium]|jgi:short-subunit dehydrogenase
MSLNPKLTDWRDRRVWIIGASSGIGAALARQLNQAGARLALSARRESALRAVAGEGDRIVPLDVADTEAVSLAHRTLTSVWGGIDLVIYCAGVYTPMRSWELNLEAVEQGRSVNLDGVYRLLQAVIPGFLEQGAGSICLVASVAGYTGLPKALVYGPFKAALINLAEILYADLAPRGIGVYLVNPGFVATRLTEHNDFTMPALIEPETAATAIIAGLGRGAFEIHFPKRFTWWLRRVSRLPDWLRLSLMKKVGQS